MRVSIAGVVAAASIGVSASSASAANDVWLWACHGPGGQALTNAQITPAAATELNGGCAAGSTDAAPAGHTLKLSGTPAAGSKSSITLNVPTGLSAKAVKVNRTLRGFAAGSNVTYRLSANGQTLETDAAPQTGAITIPNPSNTISLDLSCSADCATTPEVDVVSVAVLVTDAYAPSGGVSWNSPVDKVMKVTPSFTDQGTGLDRIELSVDGYPGHTQVIELGTCRDLSPADPANDRPVSPNACPQGVDQGLDPQNNPRPLLPITREFTLWESPIANGDPHPLQLPEGLFTRRVTVYDAAGNAAVVAGNVEVWHPPAPIAIRTLNISTASVPDINPSGPNGPPGGAVLPGSATQCRTPRLSVSLKSKPVRVTKGVPVLQYKKAYKFTGRLTCVINGKRQSAPKRTKVSILNKVGKKTVRRPNTAIRAKGAVDLKLAFVSSRTVIFRYTNAAGQKSEVKIKVRVTKKKK